MKTYQEIEAKIDELAYQEFCEAQGGNQNICGACKQSMLEWLLGRELGNLYPRGEALYRSGYDLRWDRGTMQYVVVHKDRG